MQTNAASAHESVWWHDSEMQAAPAQSSTAQLHSPKLAVCLQQFMSSQILLVPSVSKLVLVLAQS